MARPVEARTSDLLKLPMTIFFFLLLCKSVASDGTIFGTVCLTNQTELVDDNFQRNLQDLLNNLSTSFHNTTAGESPDKAYAIYLCRGDATPEICQSCVTNLTQVVISTESSNCKKQFAYADYCMIRYANYSFFGKADFSVLGPSSSGYTPKTDPQAYNRTKERVIAQVIKSAAYNSTDLFAMSEEDVDEQDKVYALAQCTPDIDRADCSRCLKTALPYIEPKGGVFTSAWSMLASCQLRYANASFHGGTHGGAAGATPPAIVSPFIVAVCSVLFINRLLHDVL